MLVIKTHVLAFVLSFQGRVCVCVCSSQSPAVVFGGCSPSSWELDVAFYPTSISYPRIPPLPCQMIFTHVSLAIEPAQGSWQMPTKRNHNSCCWATYANMFTHEGILSKKNVPHGNSLHVCRVALVSHNFKYEITGQILSTAVGVIFMTQSKDNEVSRPCCIYIYACQIYWPCMTLSGHWTWKRESLKICSKAFIG